jgi:hypothetical protein
MKQLILLLAGLGLAAPVFAAPSVPVKCATNEEKVWVYSNLTTWDVGARLKCGTLVDVLGVERGYVMVRTADGNEGYVPVSAVPQLNTSQIIMATAPAPAMTVAAAARANMQARDAQPVAAPQVAQVISENRTVTPTTALNAVREAEAAPAPPQPAAPASGAPLPPSNAVPPVAPAPVPDAAPAEQNRPAPPELPAPTQAPLPAPVPNSPASISMTNAAPQHATVVPSSAPAVAPQPNVAMVIEMPVEARSTPMAAPAQPNAALAVENTSERALVTAPEAAVTTVKPAKYTTVTRKSNAAVVRTPEFSDDDEDLPDASSIAASEDLSACSVYFSAYGVTPMQYKWIADERGKRFPGVCPAPEPSMVDYVVIFTHDMNYFTTTLPEAIHTDQNGFSDWSPVTSVDDTQIPVSLLDKAHREYAWVFRVHRGTFDPAKFTSRRRPQYTKADSHSTKSIEDAMDFMAENSATQ